MNGLLILMHFANELIFLAHVVVISLFLILSFYLGEKFLFAFICFQGVFANLFVLKQMYLFGFEVTCSDVFTVGGMVGINLLQEFYGTKISRNAVWGSFFFSILFLVVSFFQIFYAPSLHDTAHYSYLEILKFAPRIILASLASFLIVQFLELKFYVFLQKMFKRDFFFFRNSFLLILFQFLDTLIFSYLGLFGIIANLQDIIFISFLIKLLSIFIIFPIISLFLKLTTRR